MAHFQIPHFTTSHSEWRIITLNSSVSVAALPLRKLVSTKWMIWSFRV